MGLDANLPSLGALIKRERDLIAFHEYTSAYTDPSGVMWLIALAHHFTSSAWLNLEAETAWEGTAGIIKQLFPMYRLSLTGCRRR